MWKPRVRFSDWTSANKYKCITACTAKVQRRIALCERDIRHASTVQYHRTLFSPWTVQTGPTVIVSPSRSIFEWYERKQKTHIISRGTKYVTPGTWHVTSLCTTRIRVWGRDILLLQLNRLQPKIPGYMCRVAVRSTVSGVRMRPTPPTTGLRIL